MSQSKGEQVIEQLDKVSQDVSKQLPGGNEATDAIQNLGVPTWAKVIISFSTSALTVLIPAFIIYKFFKQPFFVIIFKILRLLKLFILGNKPDGLDYTNVQVKDKTFHEKVHPGIDEMEYSATPANFKKPVTKQMSIIDKKYPITMGRVRFGLKYDYEKEAFTIIIYEAQNLPAADEGGASDPYIRVMLLPDTRNRRETVVVDNCLDPIYNQTFVFEGLPYGELVNRTLCIRALDYDLAPKHDILGECLQPIVDLELPEDEGEGGGDEDDEGEEGNSIWRILAPAYDLENPGELRQSQSELGDICVGFSYNPPKKKLIVYVIECKNLKSVDEGGLSDPFVKVSLVIPGKRDKSFKTRYIEQTLDPYYNEDFQFKLDPQFVPIADVRFVVADYDTFGGADTIGEVSIGSHSYGPQQRHWRDVLLAPNKPIVCWHMLCPASKT